MKKMHHCARCSKRGARGLVRCRMPSGRFSEFCPDCIKALQGKGREIVPVDGNESFVKRAS